MPTSKTVKVTAADPKTGLTFADLKSLITEVEATGRAGSARFAGRVSIRGAITEISAEMPDGQAAGEAGSRA